MASGSSRARSIRCPVGASVLIGGVLLASALAGLGLVACAETPWAPSSDFSGARIQLPLAAAARPTLVPADHFGVGFFGAFARAPGEGWRGPLEVSAGYGLNEYVEVGLRLLRLTLVEAGEDGGLRSPSVYAAVRAVSGFVEVGARGDIELPFDGFRAADLGPFVRLHLGRWARLDGAGLLGGRFDGPSRAVLSAPLEGLVSLGPRFAVGGGAALESDDLFGASDLRIRPRGRMVFTLGDPASVPLVDVETRFEGPASRIRGDVSPIDYSIGLSIILYFDDLNDPTPLDDPSW